MSGCRWWPTSFRSPWKYQKGRNSGRWGRPCAAAVAAGIHVDYRAACKAMVRFSRHFHPRVDLAGVYAAKYSRYRRFLEVVEPAWKDLV